MKKLTFCLLSILFFAAKTNAQTTLRNQTACSMDVFVICYDDPSGPCADGAGNPSTCCIVSETKYTLDPAETLYNVPDCGFWTTYKVIETGVAGAGANVTWDPTPPSCWTYYAPSASLTGGSCSGIADATTTNFVDIY